MAGLPDAVRREIAAMGANFTPQISAATRRLLAPLIPTFVKGVEEALDLSYGADPRQTLDVYYPSERRSRSPVLLYVCGGGFTGGDKRGDAQFYGNLGRWFAAHGVLCVTMNYRLAPNVVWPAGGEDVRSAFAWIAANISAYGGDPAQRIVFGQSAGATHVATCLFDPTVRDPAHQPICAILASGLYDIERDNRANNIAAYFGSDPDQTQARSVINHVSGSSVPLFLTINEFDPPFLAIPTFQLAQAVCRRDGRMTRFLWLDGHNHTSSVLSFGTDDERLGLAVLAFIEDVRKTSTS